MKGGYQIIDLGGITVSTTATTVSGLYNKITNANGKPLLVNNFKIGSLNVTQAGFYNYYVVLGKYYIPVLDFSTGLNAIITITNEDAVQLVLYGD